MQIIEDTIKKEGNICDLNFIDTSKITDMDFLFYNHTNFDGDISMWDVSNVKTMVSMFEYCSFDGDISKWDISSVEDMNEMFYMCPLEQTYGSTPSVDKNDI